MNDNTNTADDRVRPEHRIKNFGGYMATVFRNRYDRQPKSGDVLSHFGGQNYVCKWFVKDEDGTKVFRSYWTKTDDAATPIV